MFLSSFIGKGRDRYIKGSKVIEMREHVGQTSVDLRRAWNQSTITLSLRPLCSSQDSLTNSSSGTPSLSRTEPYFFFFTRLRSS